MIITSGGTKGGSGKSTLATNLAIYLVRKGREVLLVDADDQGTTSDFTVQRAETFGGKTGYTAIQLTGAAVRTQILNMKDKYNDIIIDVGGRDTGSQRAALTVSDVCLVPLAPKSFDIWTLEKVEGLISESLSFQPNLRAFCFLNQAYTNTKIKDNEAASDMLKQSEVIKYLDTPISSRKAFSDSTASGLSVFELEHPDKKAIAEFEALVETVSKELNWYI